MRPHVIVADRGPDRGRAREKLIFLYIGARGTGEHGAAPSLSSGGRPGRVSTAATQGWRQGARKTCRRVPQGAAQDPLRGPAAALNVFTNTNSLSVSNTEPRKSAHQFVLIYGTITIDSLHRLFEFVLVRIANRDC